jgi:DNA excision repair protein ERCC-2
VNKKIAIRQLVEFIFREGDLGGAFASDSYMAEGVRLHRKIQKSSGDTYESEVWLKHTVQCGSLTLTIDGRADGAFCDRDGNWCIDEIKTVAFPIDTIDENFKPVCWAQAYSYAYIFALEKQLSQISVRLTWCYQETEEIRQFVKLKTFKELDAFFNEMIEKYSRWAIMSHDWEIKRNSTIDTLKFPFETYRRNQRELAASVYRAVRDSKRIFVNAPTGTGKTISTLFPALKALGLGHTEKIFYLSAKTINREVVAQALELVRTQGTAIRSAIITAKEKVCLNGKVTCNALECRFANGHFTRVNNALWDILISHDSYTKEVIEAYAVKHTVCPFEFALDITLWCDVIVCDYNYVFDPIVYLKRFFVDKTGKYAFLIDEAHNLVDRAREMFSADISTEQLKLLKTRLKKYGRQGVLKVNKCIRYFNNFIDVSGQQNQIVVEPLNKSFVELLRPFCDYCKELFAVHRELVSDSDLLTAYFDMVTFLKISELYDEHYTSYMSIDNKSVTARLYCLDPSHNLRLVLNRAKSSVFFSATLLPGEYFRTILGGDSEDQFIVLESPFDKANRLVAVVNDISVKYTDRESSAQAIADSILGAVTKRTGNYLAFFPSYAYMNTIYELVNASGYDMELQVQGSSMSEDERIQFIAGFKPSPLKTTIGFCVMGGMFSEGVDLKDDRCIGVFIVGAGVPQICFERDLIRHYFSNNQMDGYNYAYMFPGMNKVLQAAGRVIRTERDRGVIVLIDSRFASTRYQVLFPPEWFPHKRVTAPNLVASIQDFWERQTQ